jgi:hypothetical protein
LPGWIVKATGGSRPRTQNGKLDPTALPTDTHQPNTHTRPRTPTEHQLAAVLLVPVDVEVRLGMTHDYLRMRSMTAEAMLSREEIVDVPSCSLQFPYYHFSEL